MEKKIDNVLEVNKINYGKCEDLIKLDIKASTRGIDLGHTFTYTITIVNKSNEDLLDVNITQKIEKELRLYDIVLDSVSIMNVDRYNKFIKFHIDKIKAKEEKVIDIVVEVLDTEEKVNFESDVKLEGSYCICKKSIFIKSNTCNVKVINPKLVLNKKSVVLEAVVGEVVNFIIVAENKGNLDIDNVIIRDILESELMFLNDSVRVDGVKIENGNILSGINIGTIKVGTYKTIKFNAKILYKPGCGVVRNVCFGEYKYSVEGNSKLREGNVKSNENIILIQIANIDIYKKYDKEEISLGDEITCSIDIINNGTLEVKSIVLNEDIEDSLKLIEGTVFIKNQIINNISLSSGILVGDLNVGEKVNIRYKIKYVKANMRSSLINTTRANFNYKQTAGLIFKGEEVVNKLELNTNISNFKYIGISSEIVKESNKPNIESVDNVTTNVELLEYHIIKTIKGVSNAGQILTGYKILVQGMLKEIIEYTADDYNKSVHIVSGSRPFSVFIVLPSKFREGSKIDIDYEVEDISFKKKCKDTIYTNVVLLIIAKVQDYIG